MFYTAICDDELVYSERAKVLLDKMLDEKGIAHRTDCFSSTEELQAAMRRCDYSLLLLDIVMDKQTGLEFASELRRAGSRVNIVFMTSSAEFALDAYEVYPLTYLTKPVDPIKLRRAVQMCLERMEKQPGIVINDRKHGQIMMEYDDILYLESQKHDIVVYARDGQQYVFLGSFEAFCEKLPSDTFFRCHRSYSVNLRHTTRINNREYTMRNGDLVPISRSQYKVATEKFAGL